MAWWFLAHWTPIPNFSRRARNLGESAKHSRCLARSFLATAARAGVLIHNPSKSEPIVMLKHFGPNNPDLEIV